MKKVNVVLTAILLFVVSVFLSFNSLEVNASSNYDITAKNYIVMDKNGKVLLSKNEDEKREVASICKLMTTLITFEEIEKGNVELEDTFVASDYACSMEGSQAFLDYNQEYKVKDLIKSVIVASANDSAVVLAENIAGSEGEFVKLMNEKAKILGMKNTKYVNSTGLSEVGKEQYSSCKDTAIILNAVSDCSLYQEYSQIWMDSLVHPSGRTTELVNTNRLIKYYPYCKTGKTGFTDEAGYCLSSTALKDDLKLTCVVLGSNTSANRFTDSVVLYNQAYANFVSMKVVDKSISIENTIEVKNGKQETIEVSAEEDYYITLNKKDKENYEVVYDMYDSIKAPINIGDRVGVAKVIVNGIEDGQVNLISKITIEKQEYKDIVGKIINRLPIIK